MTKLMAACLALLCTVPCLGQSARTSVKEDDELLYAAPHISATLIPYITQKATITTQAGNYPLSSTPVMGAEGGVNYHLHFSPAYSLILGFHVGVAGRNHQLFIPKEEFSPHLQNDVVENGRFSRGADYYFALPVLVERRWGSKGGHHWNGNAGVNVRFVPENFYETWSSYADVNRQMVQVEDVNLIIGNKGKPWLNYNLGGGYTWRLPSRNFLRVNLWLNYSASEVVQGDYTVNVTGKDLTSGRYTAKQSYAGLSVSYIFTGARKISRKLQQREERRASAM